MEKERALDFILNDADLILQHVSLSMRGPGSMLRLLRSGSCDRNGHRRWGDPVLADMNMQQISGGVDTTPTGPVMSPVPPATSAGSLASADIDLTLSAVKMRECEYLLTPFAASQPIRSLDSDSKRRSKVAADRSGSQHRELELADSARQLVQAVQRRKASSAAAIERLVAAVALRDEQTGGHIARTGIYAGMVAKALGLPEDYAEMIALAATVHDIGKIGIRDSILSKPAPLTSQEFETMKTHTVLGQQMLAASSCPLLQLAASIALSHHERWDGSGYPYGLAGEQIPLASRIVTLADQYDALRSRRVYKRSLDHATTCDILSRGDAVTRPDHFDPRILKTFLGMEQQLAQACEEQQRQESARQRQIAQGWPPAFTPLCAASHGSVPALISGAYC